MPIKNDRIQSFNSQPLILCSMAANTSDRGDNMTEANLQADGLMEEPAQRAVNQ